MAFRVWCLMTMQRIRIGALVALLGVAIGLTLWAARGWKPTAPPRPARTDPRQAMPTPWRNVRPEVQYVGDVACAACHADIAETYRRHSMGRSLAPIAVLADQQTYGPDVHNPFATLGAHFVVERHGGRVLHRETRRDAHGRSVAETEVEAQYVIGSGSHARSYLFERDEFLFQSPITWYAQQGRWDLSPGFAALHDRFERAVLPECLFCHANRVEPVEHTANRYVQPIFRGYAIGCERCHGPGELHVREREVGAVVEGVDPSIVNPRRLANELREAVCQQCHLEGVQRVLPLGRQPFDYRPGLPLHLFWTVFVASAPASVPSAVASHVEQMHASTCFQASAGKLGCVSCHDPHALPEAARKVAYYRDRCMVCHAEKGCALAPAERLARSQDDCVACHMPRTTATDVAHVAITDHRVPRRPGGATGPLPRASGDLPLVAFHPESRANGRDLGIALTKLARRYPEAGAAAARMALPLLEAAVHEAPQDVAAWEALGSAHASLHRMREALAAAEAALALAPDHEDALENAAAAAEVLRQRDKAIAYWRRAVEANPWSSRTRFHLAQLLAEQKQWQPAVEQCQAVLRFNPANVEVRLLLVACRLETGDVAGAESEFQRVLALKPDDPDRLRRWYAAKRREAAR